DPAWIGKKLRGLKDLPEDGIEGPGDAASDGLSMKPLFEAILRHVPARDDDRDGPLQFQISALDYSSYVGKIGIGRIARGRVRAGQQVTVLYGDPGSTGVAPINAKVNQVLRFQGLERVVVDEAEAGDIIAINGIEQLEIGSTVCDPAQLEAFPVLSIDEPTMSMEFLVNTSPMAGREGKYVTSRQIRERLERELKANVALRVEFTADSDTFVVSGRGELHLTILLENMRREGYEMAVSRPKPKIRVVDGERQEPYELLTMDLEEAHQGGIMELLGRRKGELQNMESDGKGRVRLEYRVPARGLIGFHNEFLNMTRGTGVVSHVFDAYDEWAGEIEDRRNGVLISQDDGEAVAYALWKLQDRGRMFVKPGDPLYEGMIIGIHTRDNDLVVNPVREKKLTNVRASGKDEAVALTPPIQLTLEKAVEFIADDELVELTPKSIRLRKRYLKEHERKRAARQSDAA
ncbi:MAG TPA: EF-Tu/IF-2/RF-3 family GTPase, partial [Burkholderiaceae bacterium]|nr:EF-Tu/IF-2/RF-3 family GTPase [Burkholderiaceae bacterium]